MSLQSQLLKPFYNDPGYALLGIKPTSIEATRATIATTGNNDVDIIAPFAGTLLEAVYSSNSTLAANDTNFITFSITNLGQGGGGSTAMLAATDPNTTKATGGTGTTAGAARTLTLNGTLANLEVAKNDTLRIRFAVTGTLGAAQNEPVVSLRFAP
jgi:hypothetical protein